ncbi:MAG: DUF3108 domain-containing protein, partial [Gammaproteobacteria bacterium]|nr:DUF3108 domain-containing protein [Gammaproteobacteria bacterium]
MTNRLRLTLCAIAFWAVLLSGVAHGAASASELPMPFVARYSLTTHGATIGETEWSVRAVAEGRYAYESRSNAAGVLSLISDEEIVERSEWTLTDGMLRPMNYSYRREGGKKDRTILVDFDWENMQAKNTAKGRTWRMPVPDGTLDKLSYVLVLMADLAAEKSELQYLVADGGKLKTYELQREGNERLETALGVFDTLKVRRLRNSEDRETLLWCARELNYLPVKIEHKERDGTLLMHIQSVEGLK